MDAAVQVGCDLVDDVLQIELIEPAFGDSIDSMNGAEDVARDAAGGVGVAGVGDGEAVLSTV